MEKNDNTESKILNNTDLNNTESKIINKTESKILNKTDNNSRNDLKIKDNNSRNDLKINRNDLKIKELCLSGACHRGISYIGVLQYLEENNVIEAKSLEKVIGVSIGSFVAACYLAGYSPLEFIDIVVNYDTSTLKDIDILNSESGLAVLRGTAFREWISSVIAKKISPQITMKEFYEKTKTHFTVVATCIEDGAVYINHETEPDFLLIDALISSMNFPFVFPPYVVNGKRYVDGGLLNNFPMHMLSQEAVGLTVNFENISDIHNPFSYIGKLFELISRDRDLLRESNSKLIIRVEATDFSLIDFDMNVDDKMTLYKRGYNAAKASNILNYFKDWKKEYSKTIKGIVTKSLELKVSDSKDSKEVSNSKIL
jgi:NTE family protein